MGSGGDSGSSAAGSSPSRGGQCAGRRPASVGVCVFRAHAAPVACVACEQCRASPSAARATAVSADYAGVILVWDAQEGRKLWELSGGRLGSGGAARLAMDSATIMACGADGTVALWARRHLPPSPAAAAAVASPPVTSADAGGALEEALGCGAPSLAGRGGGDSGGQVSPSRGPPRGRGAGEGAAAVERAPLLTCRIEAAHEGGVTALALPRTAPGGLSRGRLPAFFGLAASGGEDGRVRLWFRCACGACVCVCHACFERAWGTVVA